MITHIVFFKMLPEAENASAEENVRIIVDLLHQLPSKIHELAHLQAGVDFSGTPASYDVGLVTQFKSREDLEAYRIHLEHQKVVQVILKLTSERAVVDFES